MKTFILIFSTLVFSMTQLSAQNDGVRNMNAQTPHAVGQASQDKAVRMSKPCTDNCPVVKATCTDCPQADAIHALKEMMASGQDIKVLYYQVEKDENNKEVFVEMDYDVKDNRFVKVIGDTRIKRHANSGGSSIRRNQDRVIDKPKRDIMK